MNKLPVATILTAGAGLITAAAGAVVVIVHPESLSFGEYLNDVTKAGAGAGLLAIGRGLHLGLSSNTQTTVEHVVAKAEAEIPAVEQALFATSGPEAEIPGGGPAPESDADSSTSSGLDLTQSISAG